jgi:hypothetical protein
MDPTSMNMWTLYRMVLSLCRLLQCIYPTCDTVASFCSFWFRAFDRVIDILYIVVSVFFGVEAMRDFTSARLSAGLSSQLLPRGGRPADGMLPALEVAATSLPAPTASMPGPGPGHGEAEAEAEAVRQLHKLKAAVEHLCREGWVYCIRVTCACCMYLCMYLYMCRVHLQGYSSQG